MESLPDELLNIIFTQIAKEEIAKIPNANSYAENMCNWQNINNLRLVCRRFKSIVEHIFEEVTMLILEGECDEIYEHYFTHVQPMENIHATATKNNINLITTLGFIFAANNKYYFAKNIGSFWLFKISYNNGINYYTCGNCENYNLYLKYVKYYVDLDENQEIILKKIENLP